MTVNSIGDLARGFVLRQQGDLLKSQMTRLTEELSSGVTTNTTRHLSGNFMQLGDVKHKLAMLGSHRVVAEQGRIESAAMQTALDRIAREAGLLSDTALALGTGTGASSFSTLSKEARGTVGAILSTLNVSAGGKSLFSGDAVTSPAVSRLDDFMIAIRNAAAGSASAADVTAAMDDFFETPGGGFETLVYQGSTSPRASFPLGEGESVSLDLRADDPAIRATLKQAAIASLLDDPGVILTSADQVELVRQVGEALLNTQNRVTGIQADLGFAESRIDRAASRISTEMYVLTEVQAELLAIDPFAAASELETVQIRLETLYTLTSRMSRLNLVNFLS